MASNTFDINLVVFKNYICSFYTDFRFIFVMFPRLCQNLRLCTIFRQIWTIRGSDADVYLFSKCWRPLFWIFVIRHLITWPVSYACDSASSLQISSFISYAVCLYTVLCGLKQELEYFKPTSIKQLNLFKFNCFMLVETRIGILYFACTREGVHLCFIMRPAKWYLQF